MKSLSFKTLLLIVLILSISGGDLLFSADEVVDTNIQFTFAIRYLGLKVADVRLNDTRTQNEGRIDVIAKSVSLGNILFKINNKYSVEYQRDYIPYSYSKSIEQKNFTQEKTTLWFPLEKRMEIKVDNTLASHFHYEEEQFHDFFSALLYIRDHIVSKEPQDIYIYANSNFWVAQISKLGEDKIGKRNTIKYSINFQQSSNNQKQRSDVLTNNIIKEDNTLYLWFTDDDERLPLQAEYDTSPFSVFWTLESYEISSPISYQNRNFE
ncbi:MAG: DUF3108 domain-containing protein [Candidatus Cloacimonetes bacterium]|nr:DUF3108 domain-containing protein [Candidatus Cloacimonadota bacterium]